MEPGGAWDDRKHQRGRGGAASLPILPQIRSDSFSHRAGTVFWNSASQNVARKSHSGSINLTSSEFAPEKSRELMNGLRENCSRVSEGGARGNEVPVNLDF